MKNQEVRERIKEVGIVAAIRLRSREAAQFAAEAVFQGGIPVVEISMTLDEAPQLISQLIQRNPGLIVGAGSVLNADVAQACLDAGAQFLTSDRLHLPLVEFARKKELVVFPGALTPSEVIDAWEAGCDFVKVVPCGQIGGDAYIDSLHGMFPKISLMAAGGINQLTASKYIFAGAVALGIGRQLIPAEAIQNRQESRIHELTRRFVAVVKGARKGTLLPVPEGDNFILPT